MTDAGIAAIGLGCIGTFATGSWLVAKAAPRINEFLRWTDKVLTDRLSAVFLGGTVVLTLSFVVVQSLPK